MNRILLYSIVLLGLTGATSVNAKYKKKLMTWKEIVSTPEGAVALNALGYSPNFVASLPQQDAEWVGERVNTQKLNNREQFIHKFLQDKEMRTWLGEDLELFKKVSERAKHFLVQLKKIHFWKFRERESHIANFKSFMAENAHQRFAHPGVGYEYVQKLETAEKIQELHNQPHTQHKEQRIAAIIAQFEAAAPPATANPFWQKEYRDSCDALDNFAEHLGYKPSRLTELKDWIGDVERDVEQLHRDLSQYVSDREQTAQQQKDFLRTKQSLQGRTQYTQQQRGRFLREKTPSGTDYHDFFHHAVNVSKLQ